jgi:hypothetical protein
MRTLFGFCFALTVAVSAAQSVKAKKDAKHADLTPKQGIKTPGVQIPFANLKAEAELPLAPQWMVFSDSVLIPNKAGGLERLDAKTNKLIDPVTGFTNLCGGATTAFTSLWIPSCGEHSLVRLDAKIAADPKAAANPRGGGGRGGRGGAAPADGEAKPPAEGGAKAEESKSGDEKKADAKDSEAKAPPARQGGGRGGRGGGGRGGPAKLAEPVKIDAGVGSANPAVAANADSVFLLSDDKTTLSRIDPDQNKVISELRMPAGCNTLTFASAALWLTCPSENKVLRVNPETDLVEKRIEVSAQPTALLFSDASIWVLCLKEGKIERIDPKTNKVTKTIDTGVTGATAGGIATGAGSIWVTMTGFPLTRIDPVSEKVVQQFWGVGGGAIHFGDGSLWLTNLNDGTLWRIDPKRVLATLAE